MKWKSNVYYQLTYIILYLILNRQVMITLNREQLSNFNLYLSSENDFKPLRGKKKKVAQKNTRL